MKPKSSPGIRLSLKILSLLSRGGLSFGQLQEALGGPTAATLSRNLKVLTEEDWVAKGEDQIYRLAGAMTRASCSYLTAKTGMVQILPLVEELAESTGESAAFARWDGEGIVFTAKKEMADSFHYIPLGRRNTHNSYNGFNITCLAYLPEGFELASAKPRLGSVFSREEEIRPCFERIRREEVFFCHDTVMRVTAPVFYGQLKDKQEKIPAGVLGVSLIPREIPSGKIEEIKKKVREAAGKAGDMLPGGYYEKN